MKRASLILVIVFAAGFAARVAAPAPEHHAAFSAALACGFERWGIKTLKNQPRLLRARTTTVAQLASLAAPIHLPARRRLPFERRVFTVVARVTYEHLEADLDYHFVLRSGPRTMLAETPSPLCTKGATGYRRRQMANSRKAARICPRARVTGVAFFDYLRGQFGAAPNGIELHPVLDFACLA